MEASSTRRSPKSNANSADLKETPNFLVEVNNIEKQLWTLIHSKGISHPNVSELYTKAGLTYERIFKSNLEHEELQEVEFCLWKLHYKHIDEFRKGIKTEDPIKQVTHMKAFKLFLITAAEFYQNLISKVRGHYYRLSEESGQKESGRFLCHRFYICLGDLERYKEQYLKMHKQPNWSTAATYYLEAAKSWPHSGNPHNQLAVLATYVGDEFLALYHCVRSLAVKEPFPGAWNNLLLLFEKNRSSPLQSLSTDAHFNFLTPSERLVNVKNVREDRDFLKPNGELMAGIDLWPLVVRTTSFFFLKSSFDEFGSTFASTMRALDAVLAADDSNLGAMLESYQVMGMTRKGPYRVLQLVSVFIFIFQNLAQFSGSDNVKEEVEPTNLALTMVFIIMGRVVERCLEDSCPLLPALLVFLDFLPFLLQKAEECRFDDKNEIAISYFFDKLVDFLNRLKLKDENSSAKLMVALWEDHELSSLTYLAPIHVRLDFSSHMDLRESFDRGKELRLQRIINAAIEISSTQKKGSQKWIFFDKQGGHFYTSSGELQCKEEMLQGNGEEGTRKCVTTDMAHTGEIIPCENERSVPVEEEVILLKPLVRCQSAPIYSSSIATKPLSSDKETSGDQTNSSDESLRRTLSLVVNHSPRGTNSESFSFMQGPKDTDQQHLQQLEEGTVSGRPPSLSAWVVDKNKENGRLSLSKSKGLSPIDETSPITSFDSLSISSSTEHPASLYSPPTPSAPLLPEDASWFHDGGSTNKTESFYDQTRFMMPYRNPPFVGISSSEWLRRYRESRNIGPAYSYQAQGTNDSRKFLDHGSSKFSLLARYGTPNEQTMISSENSTFYPQLYMEDSESRGEKMSNGQQSTTNAYGFTDDPGPFLRFLREKERLNENGQRLRGPSPA